MISATDVFSDGVRDDSAEVVQVAGVLARRCSFLRNQDKLALSHQERTGREKALAGIRRSPPATGWPTFPIRWNKKPQPVVLITNDASESDVASRRVGGFALPGGWPISQTVVRGTEMRPAFHDNQRATGIQIIAMTA